jgi:HEPN domain-containing protein
VRLSPYDHEAPEPPVLRTRINDFAIRTFRDTTDGDYITARLAHRAGLIPQFLWSGLQAIEKYLKGILLINRIPSQKATHGIVGLLAKVEAITKLRINVAKETRDFIQYLNDYGQFRYLEVSYHARGADLIRLDRTVWELRRYCALLDYIQTRTDGTTVSRLAGELRLLERASAHGTTLSRESGRNTSGFVAITLKSQINKHHRRS